MNGISTEVLNPWTKLLGFHMPDLATCPCMPNKEMLVIVKEKKSKHSSPSSFIFRV
jgi:hypothetical protein